MSVKVVTEAAVAARTERQVAIDTLAMLIETKLLASAVVAEAMKIIGITLPEIVDARHVFRISGYQKPTGKPVDISDVLAEKIEKVERVCAVCDKKKPLSAFAWRNKKNLDKHTECKACQNKKWKVRYMTVEMAQQMNAANIAFKVDDATGIKKLHCTVCAQPFKNGDLVSGRTKLTHASCLG